jgi:hypothetical protein
MFGGSWRVWLVLVGNVFDLSRTGDSIRIIEVVLR